MKMINGVRYYGRQHDRGEDVTKCIEEVCPHPHWISYQCSRNRGHGLDGLYCKQHDPDRIKAKQEAEDKNYKDKWAKERRRETRSELEQEYCKPFTSAEMKRRIKMRKEGEQV